MLTAEQEGGALPREVGLERRGIPVQLALELGIGRFLEQLDRGSEVVGPGQDVVPRRQLGSQAVGLAEDLLRGALVVPEAGLLGQRVEVGDALGLRLEVKDAPRSIGSVRPGRGWRTRPPSSGPGDPGAGSGAAR